VARIRHIEFLEYHLPVGGERTQPAHVQVDEVFGLFSSPPVSDPLNETPVWPPPNPGARRLASPVYWSSDKQTWLTGPNFA
jgi:hypothetical protein